MGSVSFGHRRSKGLQHSNHGKVPLSSGLGQALGNQGSRTSGGYKGMSSASIDAMRVTFVEPEAYTLEREGHVCHVIE